MMGDLDDRGFTELIPKVLFSVDTDIAQIQKSMTGHANSNR